MNYKEAYFYLFNQITFLTEKLNQSQDNSLIAQLKLFQITAEEICIADDTYTNL